MAQYIPGIKPYQPKSFKTGSITVGTTAVQGPNVVIAAGRSVVLTAPTSNTANIAVGGDNTVTLSNGLIIEPGGGAMIEVDNLNRLWFIAGAANQTLNYATESE